MSRWCVEVCISGEYFLVYAWKYYQVVRSCQSVPIQISYCQKIFFNCSSFLIMETFHSLLRLICEIC